jgi:hypothetical protein
MRFQSMPGSILEIEHWALDIGHFLQRISVVNRPVLQSVLQGEGVKIFLCGYGSSW